MARSVSISPVQTKFWDEIKTHPNIPYEPFGASACEDISSDYRRATSRSLNGEAGPIGRPFFLLAALGATSQGCICRCLRRFQYVPKIAHDGCTFQFCP